MEKRVLIEKIRAAKTAHIKFRSYVNITINGIDSNEIRRELPLNNTECTFGKWYYGEGMVLSYLPSYNALDKPHEMVHTTYIKMYSKQMENLKVGFFDSKDSVEKKRNEEIAKLGVAFNNYCEILISLLMDLEIEIMKMTQEELNELVLI